MVIDLGNGATCCCNTYITMDVFFSLSFTLLNIIDAFGWKQRKSDANRKQLVSFMGKFEGMTGLNLCPSL